jgi:hypothetical protein
MNRRGSSLTGLLTATALAAMVAVAAAPQLAAQDPAQAEAPARQLVVDLRAAQRLAVSQRSSYLLEFSPVPGPYSRYVMRPEEMSAEDHLSRMLPRRVVAFGPPQVIFRANGTTVGGTITVSAGGRAIVIRISPVSGQIATSRP